MTEKDLVIEYRRAKDEVEELEDKLKQAKDRFEKAQLALVDELQSKGASQSAVYDGVGRVTILKPVVGARVENEDELFEYLRAVGRDDLMKTTVHHRTLSSFVKEMLEEGKNIPDFIQYWFKPSTRLNK